MKYIIILLIASNSCIGQNIQKEFIQKYFWDDLPKNISCDSIYRTLDKYKAYNESKTEAAFLTARAIDIKSKLYKRTFEEKNCDEIRVRILNDMYNILKNESTDYESLSGVISFYYSVISKQDSEKYNLKVLMQELLEKRKPENVRGATGIIKKYHLKEYSYYFWSEFENTTDEQGMEKVGLLKSIRNLGDSSRVFKQYSSDIWRIVNNKEKLIDEDYLSKLIEFIGRGYFDKSYVEELFKLLEFVEKNKDKNKKIFMYEDSDSGRQYGEVKNWTFIALRGCLKFPDDIFIDKVSDENIKKLLEWRKRNPNYELKKITKFG